MNKNSFHNVQLNTRISGTLIYPASDLEIIKVFFRLSLYFK